MPELERCPICQTVLPASAPAGFCPTCEFRGALGHPIHTDATNLFAGAPPLEKERLLLSELKKIRYFGDFELLEEIASGGMGTVFKARQIPLNRVVALKLISAGVLASQDLVKRFKVEAELAAGLNHANIVPIHEIGEHEGRHYFSMTFIEGPTLSTALGRKPMDTQRAAQLVATLARAIHYAHQRGVLHRDLKPSNVLLNADGEPHLTDFGLAKLIEHESTLTHTNAVLGTPAYMSPEQARGEAKEVTTATDVYGLGAILYETLTGTPPFGRGTSVETIRQVLDEEPRRPSSFNPELDRDLETICLKCLEKAPPRRYGSAEALANDLERWLRREPIIARPVSARERMIKWARRKPAIACLGSVTMLLLAALVVGSPIAAWRINRERVRAEKGELDARQKAYASDMNLAQQALKLNNLGKARRLLDRHRPKPGEQDFREWEWRYLWQLTRSGAMVTLTNRPTRGFSVSFSPDGSRLAVGWYDGRVDLWDVGLRRLVRALTDREHRHQGRVAFSPVRNLLAATSQTGVVTLYDLDADRESGLWRAPDQGAWQVRDLEFSPDGSRVVIYAGSTSELGDQVWVINVSSSQIENRHSSLASGNPQLGAAQLSPDNRRLYLARSDTATNYRYSIQCINLLTGKELWETERERDRGLTTLAVSPDGQVLASGSGFEDSTIRVWDTVTGRLLVRLDGHTGWVCKLAFSKDGRHLISAASDQSIRFWNTRTWDENRVLRGHTDEVHAVAFSEPAQLVASASKDGDLLLWKQDESGATDGYFRLADNLQENDVLPLDHSRLLLLPPGRPAELLDLKRDSVAVSLPEIGSSTNVLGWFSPNILCHWNGTNEMLIRELRGAEFALRGTIPLVSSTRPTGVTFNVARQLMAWTDESSSALVHLARLRASNRRTELKSGVPGMIPVRFNDEGKYLAAITTKRDSLCVWSVETEMIVASVGGPIRDTTFAAGGRVLVAAIDQGNDHEIRFYDLAHPGREPKRVPGRNLSWSVAVSPDGGLLASATIGGQVRLFDPVRGELIETMHGHLNAVFGVAFSADGRRLISASGGREAVKLWDVATRQELLNLSGVGSALAARWSSDGDVILAGPPWQIWRAPSWEEIAAAEAKKTGRTQQRFNN